MLKKIDCIMVKVDDPEEARDFYVRVLGMRQVWSDDAEGSIGLRFPDGDTEIVLHRIASIPAKVDVTYLVDDVPRALQTLEREGCTVVAAPFEVAVGKCAVVVDPLGTPLSLIDLTNPVGVKARSGKA
jgi:catechol 2,3-dioxygenase-like lactoylglutathione lyase family enzyme